MPLLKGTRLGPYEIVAPLGRGGMGEVYRATDTRLDRTVAIKILQVQTTDSGSRRRRFEQEARALSSLTHPNICALYDVGEHEGVPFLVMEYLEGETLAHCLVRGALPIDQVLRHAVGVADALDHAHRQGIVHRDLKPANIMLTRTGVKLLDFGIAKLWAPEPPGGTSLSVTGPTDTITDEGTIVGSLHYMAPEQLEGRTTDRRADIFAFGAVVYEMATGQRAFDGRSRASVIAAVLDHVPAPLSATLGEMPPRFGEVVMRCLAKDPGERWQTASDLKQALTWMADTRPEAVVAAPAWARRRVVRLAWSGVAIVLIGTLAAVFMMLRRAAPQAPAYQFEVFPPENATFNPAAAFMAISPDGRYLAFVASSSDGNSALWIRPRDAVAARQLPGTEGASQEFWSPDSRFIAFGAGGKSYKIDVRGGSPQIISEESLQTGTWNRDGTIIFRNGAIINKTQQGLSQVSDNGGAATSATTLDAVRSEVNHQFPQFLPDGRHFLYLATSSRPEEDAVVYVGELGTHETLPLLHADSQAVYAPPGYLLFMRRDTLYAQPFDAAHRRLTGAPVALPERVERSSVSRRAAFSVSETGVLAYRSVGETEIVSVDRAGRPIGSVGPPGHYSNPALSRDERRLAVGRLDPATGKTNIWLTELARGVTSRFTFGPSSEDMPLWSPDGLSILFRRDGQLYRKASGGTGSEEHLPVEVGGFGAPLDAPRDGRSLIYDALDVKTKQDLWVVPLTGDRAPRPFLQTPFNEFGAQLSPDGRWIAYVSDESGRNEVYVRPFPSGEGQWQVSANGGIEPKWRGDGKEIFYLAADRSLMAVAVRAGNALELNPASRLFTTRMSVLTNKAFTSTQYAVTADGEHFFINQPREGAASSPITVVVNWAEALKN